MSSKLPPPIDPAGDDESDDSLAARPTLRPPQFKLSSLFWATTACGLLFAAMVAAGPLGAAALLMLVLLVIAHIAGASIGTRLRQIGDACDSQKAPDRPRRRTVAQHEFAPETQLCRRTCVSRTMISFTIAGAVLLGCVGSGTLFWLTWGQVNVPTAIVAIGSSSFLGGFVGFIGSSFLQTAGAAWWQARRGVK